MAGAVGDHGTDFYVAFCTKFIAVVVLKIPLGLADPRTPKMCSILPEPETPGEKKVLQEGTSSEMPQDSHSGGLPPFAKDVLHLRKMCPRLYIQCHRIIHKVTLQVRKQIHVFSGKPCSNLCVLSSYILE